VFVRLYFKNYEKLFLFSTDSYQIFFTYVMYETKITPHLLIKYYLCHRKHIPAFKKHVNVLISISFFSLHFSNLYHVTTCFYKNRCVMWNLKLCKWNDQIGPLFGCMYSIRVTDVVTILLSSFFLFNKP
jgi:hypothetical protein